MNCCQNCSFFQLTHPQRVPNALGVGECRRRPPDCAPTAVRSEAFPLGRFPMVTVRDWCGDFELRRDREGTAKSAGVPLSNLGLP